MSPSPPRPSQTSGPVSQASPPAERAFSVPQDIRFLQPHEVATLTQTFRAWSQAASQPAIRLSRRRVWLIYLLLRFTGAKLGEVLGLDDTRDFNLRAGTVSFPGDAEDAAPRVVQMPQELLAEVRDFLTSPAAATLRGQVFRMDGGYLRKKCYERAAACGLPKELANPRVLRHTRAVELLRLGLPLPAVQYLLGHGSINLTAHYLSFTDQDIQSILHHYLHKEAQMKTSARNTFTGSISRVQRGPVLAEVELTTPSGLRVVSVITNESLDNLGLRPGVLATATVKAPWVVLVASASRMQTSARNKFCGTISRINSGPIAAEVVVDLPDGTKVVALITEESVRALDLQVGNDICALFKAFSVILNTVD